MVFIEHRFTKVAFKDRPDEWLHMLMLSHLGVQKYDRTLNNNTVLLFSKTHGNWTVYYDYVYQRQCYIWMTSYAFRCQDMIESRNVLRASCLYFNNTWNKSCYIIFKSCLKFNAFFICFLTARFYLFILKLHFMQKDMFTIFVKLAAWLTTLFHSAVVECGTGRWYNSHERL
jgi:hypothetical protein